MGLALIMGTLDESIAWIGRELPSSVGADEATVPDFRRLFEAVEFHSPINSDRSAAVRAGYRDVVAPAAMLRPLSHLAYWNEGDGSRTESVIPGPEVFRHVPGPGTAVVATGVVTEYHEPVYPGDKIVATSTLRSVTPKKTTVGDGAFLVVETRYTKAGGGELCGVEELTFFRYIPSSTAEHAPTQAR